MVVLDHGFFSSFDCGPRMGFVFLVTFIAQIGIVAGCAAKAHRPNRNHAVEMIDDQPFFTRRRFTVLAAWCAIFIVVSGICACLRTTTAVFLDSGFIVETSCSGPFRDEYRLDRAKLDVSFVHDPTWLSKQPLQSAYLMVAEDGRPRPIYIGLHGRTASKELVEFAPEAMTAYAGYRSSLGFR